MTRRTQQLDFGGAEFTRLAALCICLGFPLSAQGQVLEIGASGDVIVHDRPEVFSNAGATAIDIPRPAKRPAPATQRTDGADLFSAAQNAKLSPELVEAVAWAESRRRPGLVSPAGAIGEMQLMPGTARAMGVDPFVSRQNYWGGATYLSGLMKRYDGDVVRALAAYNAGPGSVDRYGGMPPFKATQDYVAGILDRLSQRADTPER